MKRRNIIVGLIAALAGKAVAVNPTTQTALGTASVTSTCPACEQKIDEGQDYVFRVVKGRSVPVHFFCAYKRQTAGSVRRAEQLKQMMSKK